MRRAAQFCLLTLAFCVLYGRASAQAAPATYEVYAVRYATLTFDKVLTDKLNVMDATAIVMCRDNRLPLRVFNLNNSGDLTRIVKGEDVGTTVTFE